MTSSALVVLLWQGTMLFPIHKAGWIPLTVLSEATKQLNLLASICGFTLELGVEAKVDARCLSIVREQ